MDFVNVMLLIAMFPIQMRYWQKSGCTAEETVGN